MADTGRFELVGSGDLAGDDLEDVRRQLEMAPSGAAVFVCVARPREIEEVLGKNGQWGTKRITWSERVQKPLAPSRAAVARGARVAVLPREGIVWVDGERLFTVGEHVPLPWTEPLVTLLVVRPKSVRQALSRAVGQKGPRRAQLRNVS